MVHRLFAAIRQQFDDAAVGLQTHAQHGIPPRVQSRPEA
jgi:hypothetical protein